MAVHNPHWSLTAPLAHQRPCQPIEVLAGFHVMNEDNMQSLPSPTAIDAAENTLSTEPGPSSSTGTPLSLMEQMTHKRALLTMPQTAEKRWKQRTCTKCAHPECGGKARSTYCKYACQDCNKFKCHGRNSKKPHLNCKEGWD